MKRLLRNGSPGNAPGDSPREIASGRDENEDEVVGDLLRPASLSAACKGIATILHCAGHAHAFSSTSNAAARLHWNTNFEGTRNLVEAAGKSGVRRLVFLSSVKAMADPGKACADEDWPGEPTSAYGIAKRAAEREVLEGGERFGMRVVVLRLVMVYGPGSRGNLERMFRLVRSGIFPPLPETGNKRSLVHVDDVVDAMRRVTTGDRASGRTYIVTGPSAYSGRELYDAMRATAGMPRKAWAVPRFALRALAGAGDLGGALLGKRLPFDGEALDRLLGSAWYSGERLERDLQWRARIDLAEGLASLMVPE